MKLPYKAQHSEKNCYRQVYLSEVNMPVFLAFHIWGPEVSVRIGFAEKEEEMEEKKKSSKGLLIGLVILVAACIAGWLLYQNFMPKGEKGAKTVTVKVVHGDQTTKEFEYKTDEAYLGAVIQSEGLVEGEDGQYGLFITSVDGEKADDTKQQWWCLTKGGGQVNTSADQTPIADGDVFELTLTEGY